MATFSVRFLGCKVSYAAAQAVRERVVADGHAETKGRGDVAVVNTRCVTNEAGYALPRLLREVGAIEGVERLRLSLTGAREARAGQAAARAVGHRFPPALA